MYDADNQKEIFEEMICVCVCVSWKFTCISRNPWSQ